MIFTSNKALEKASYTLDGNQTVIVTDNSTIENVTEGFHNIMVQAYDNFGNLGTSQTINFSITSLNAQKSENLSTFTASVIFTISVCGVSIAVTTACLLYTVKDTSLSIKLIRLLKLLMYARQFIKKKLSEKHV